MELYILNRKFLRENVIESFHSLIWTERYYGDSEVELVVPLTLDMIQKLPEGTFLSVDKSNEPMIIETVNIEDGKLKATGISICSWLNNRFIRTGTANPGLNHRKTTWKLVNKTPGQILGTIVREMCTDKSAWLNGSKSMGLHTDAATSTAREKELIVPGLKVGAEEKTMKPIKKFLVNFGPVYNELRRIADKYKVGMQVTLASPTDTHPLEFRSYKGADRSKTVRFSSIMDSLADMKEIRSIAPLKTLVYAFASNLEKIDTSDSNSDPDTWLQTSPGVARLTKDDGTKYTGFDLRAHLLLAGDINIKQDLSEENPESTLAGEREELRDVLTAKAETQLKENKYIRTVDGEVSPQNLFKIDEHYDLGDLVTVQGLTEVTEISRVMEYIRVHDEQGERAYPTVEAVEP